VGSWKIRKVPSRLTCKTLNTSQTRTWGSNNWGFTMFRMESSRAWVIPCAIVLLVSTALAGDKKGDEQQCATSFVVLKDDSGKPIRNAAVVLHPVGKAGRQMRSGFELKTDPDGKTHFDAIPYGLLRVQVVAHGFQTFGQDYTIDKPSAEIVIRLKRPQGQYSIYEKHDENGAPQPNQQPEAPQP